MSRVQVLLEAVALGELRCVVLLCESRCLIISCTQLLYVSIAQMVMVGERGGFRGSNSSLLYMVGEFGK